jgi:hypothetical protein
MRRLDFVVPMLIAAATLGDARAGAQTAPADAEPRLQISRFAGRIEVETPNWKSSVPGQEMPSLRSGSIVRVFADSAVFRSDVHATVRAGKGDVFYFAAFKPEGGRPGFLRIAAIETEPKALEVVVGGERFRLSKGAGLSVAATGPGEATVKSEWGNVKVASGDRTMAAGESLRVLASEDAELEGPAMSLAGVSVTRRSETTFEVAGEARADAQSLARGDEARRVVSLWPEASKTVAEAMLEKYGPPDRVDIDRLSWNDNGSWRKTTVYRLPREGEGVLEQTIRYDVPQDKRAALSSLDLSVKVRQVDDRLSVASESEETNFLALNLIDEVIREKKTPEEAREFYRKEVKLFDSGKTSSYMQGLLFRP